VLRIIRTHPLAADAALAVGLCVLVLAEALLGPVERAARLPDALTAPLLTLPLVLRRRYPASVAVLVVAAVKVQALAGGSERNTIAPILPLSVAMYSLALHAERRRLVVATAGCAALLVLLVNGRADDLLFVGILLAVPFALGLAVRGRQRRVEDLEQQARAALADERARIARELHDVVAHSVGVMTVQAAAALRVMNRRPDQAGEALAAIESTGREALAEMRRMVGVLRERDEAEPLAPQPSLRHLDGLLEQMRTAGLVVDTEVDPPSGSLLAELPPGVDLAAYRIIQEALTNALKHSRAQRARVLLRRLPGELQVDVLDPGPPLDGTKGGGHGLIGMRERVQLYGGRLEAATTADGGFAVRVRLPVGP
jgi:signal transduction histidine kinase